MQGPVAASCVCASMATSADRTPAHSQRKFPPTQAPRKKPCWLIAPRLLHCNPMQQKNGQEATGELTITSICNTSLGGLLYAAESGVWTQKNASPKDIIPSFIATSAPVIIQVYAFDVVSNADLMPKPTSNQPKKPTDRTAFWKCVFQTSASGFSQ